MTFVEDEEALVARYVRSLDALGRQHGVVLPNDLLRSLAQSHTLLVLDLREANRALREVALADRWERRWKASGSNLQARS